MRRLISSHTPWNVDEVCVKRNPPSSGASAPWWWSRATGSSARIHVRSSRALSSKPWRRPRNLENRAAPRHDVLTMTQTSLIFKRAAASHRSGKWNDDDFEVLADGRRSGPHQSETVPRPRSLYAPTASIGCPLRSPLQATRAGHPLRDPNWLLGGGFCRSRWWLRYHYRIGNRLRNIDGFRAGLMGTNHARPP